MEFYPTKWKIMNSMRKKIRDKNEIFPVFYPKCNRKQEGGYEDKNGLKGKC